jgi:translation elongation factor EF-G
MTHGILTGSPVVDFRITLPLEPIMHLEITVPDESMGDVIGDFHMSFSYYEEVPPHLSERVIKEVRETRGVTGQHHHE